MNNDNEHTYIYFRSFLDIRTNEKDTQKELMNLNQFIAVAVNLHNTLVQILTDWDELTALFSYNP